jgi:hypothetical protein
VQVRDGLSFTAGHHFTVDPSVDVAALAEQLTGPLSVIVQVTKRCDFDCSFCSETLQLPDPTIAQLVTIRDNLAGVPLRYHKTWINPVTGKLETDLRAGWITARQGWVDAGALARDYTVTTNNPPDGAPCRIGRIMVSPPLAAGLFPGSYRVRKPETRISDHPLVSVRVDPSQYGKPFQAPWWDEDRLFGAETWIGGDTSSDPNANNSWGLKG